MVENDLKPCYVFDGKPPQLKSNVVRNNVLSLSTSTATESRPAPCSSRSVFRTVRRRRRTRRRRRRPVSSVFCPLQLATCD